MADDEKLWPDETEKDFIHFMLKEAVDGNASFQWDTVTTKFNEIYEKSYTQNQINGKYVRLRKRYLAFTYLIGCDYISYDARTNTFKGSKDAWARAKRASVIHLFNFHAAHSLNSSCKQFHITMSLISCISHLFCF